MKKVALYLRLSLVVVALAMAALSIAPAPAEAWKSCEYYCGDPGPAQCPYAPSALSCTWWGW